MRYRLTAYKHATFVVASGLLVGLAPALLAQTPASTAPAKAPKRTSTAVGTFDPLSVRSVKQHLKQLQEEAQKHSRANEDANKKAQYCQGPKQETGPESGRDLLGAWLYHLTPRAYPFDRIDWSAYDRAAAERDSMRPASLPPVKTHPANPTATAGPRIYSVPVGAAVTTPKWSFIGPPGIGNKGSWRVSGVTYDPRNTNILYAAGSRGGVWRSADGGNTWTPLTDTMPQLPVSCVAVDTGDSNTIFVGTGEYETGTPGYGLLKGHFDGTKWTFKIVGGAQFGTEAINKILTNPITPSKLFATAGLNGVFMSLDSGETWTQVIGVNALPGAPAVAGSFSDLCYNASFETVYASSDFGGGVYQSTNGGTTWTQVSGAPTPTGRMAIAASPVLTPRGRKTLYVLNASDMKVYKGAPPGTNGAPPDDNDTGTMQWGTLDNFPNDPGLWTSSPYDFYIACSTSNDRVTIQSTDTPPKIGTVTRDVVYVGLQAIVLSPDGGLLWQILNTPAYEHAIAINPVHPLQAICGSDEGIFRLNYTPVKEPLAPMPIPVPLPNPLPMGLNPPFASASSAGISTGLGIAQFDFAAYHPTDPTIALGGTQSNGTVTSQFGLKTWDEVLVGDGGGCGINQNNPLIQYASAMARFGGSPATTDPYYPISHTTDGWRLLTDDISLFVGGDVMPLFITTALNAADQNLYYAGTNYLYQFDERTYNGAQTPQGYSANWKKFRQQFSATGSVSAIGTTTFGENWVYVGTTDGAVWYTNNANVGTDLATFSEIDQQGMPGGLPQRSISKIVVSPVNPTKIYATVSGTGTPHVWVCDNTTAVSPFWHSISGNLPDIPTNTMVVMPRNNDAEMFVGTDIGVFYTTNGGGSWQNATVPLGLPNVQVNDLTYVPGTGNLQAATFGRGIWTLPVGAPITIPVPVISFKPYLQSYRGDRTKLRLTAKFYLGGVNVFTVNGNLKSDGSFTVQLPRSGATYDVLISVPHFLSKKILAITINPGNNPTLQPTLLAGDVNGDNAVTQADITAIQKVLGLHWTGPEDVNGDGIVNTQDLNIAQGNLGQVGDTYP